jgi:hypothetical protein
MNYVKDVRRIFCGFQLHEWVEDRDVHLGSLRVVCIHCGKEFVSFD